MSTTARLGIDIVGFNRTQHAFTQVQHSLHAFQKTLSFIAGAGIGLAGGHVLKELVLSFVDINKHVKPVEESFTKIDRAWQAFALRVGSSGLNKALIDFNMTVSQLIVGFHGLANEIGSSMGSALETARIGLEYAGRAAKFLNDNLGDMSTLGARAGEAMGTRGFADSLKQFFGIKNVADDAVNGMKSLGLNTDALTMDFNKFNKEIDQLPKTFKEIEDATKAGEPSLKAYQKGMVDLKQYVVGLGDQAANLGKTDGALARLTQSQAIYNKMQDQGVTLIKGQKEAIEQWLDKIPAAVNALAQQKSALQNAIDIGDAFKSSFSSAFASIVDGTASVVDAFKSMASNLLSTLTNLIANKAFAMLIEGGAGAGGTGGLVGMLFGAFGGAKAAGGPVSAGKTYLVGEHGPEMFAPGRSGSIIPNRAMGGSNVQIIDMRHGGAPALERHSDGKGNLKVFIRDAVNETLGGGFADKSMKRFGTTPVKARRT